MEIYPLRIIQILIGLIEIYYLLKILSFTKRDVSSFKFEQGEKENFFIDPDNNPNPDLEYDYDCMKYEDLIKESTTEKLGNVFDFKIEKIHKASYKILILSFISISIGVIIILIAILINIIPSIRAFLSYFILGAVIILILCGLIIFYFIIMMFYYYYSGDIEHYKEFLACKNVNYEGFNRYKLIELLKSDFKKYEIFYLLNWIVLNAYARNRNY